MADWYYLAGDARIGPRPAEEIRALVRAGTITGDTLVWTEGMNGWTPAATSPLAAEFAGLPPPPPGSLPPPLPDRAPAAAAPGGPAPWRGFGEAVRICFGKYLTFSGRASRSEYWWFALFCAIAGTLLSVADRAFGTGGPEGGLLAGLFSLATFLPTLAVTSRRFHDAGWRFWWCLLPLAVTVAVGLPLAALGSYPDGAARTGPLLVWVIAVAASGLFLFYLLVAPPEPGPNRFDRA